MHDTETTYETGKYHATIIEQLGNSYLQPSQTHKYHFAKPYQSGKGNHTNNGNGFGTENRTSCIKWDIMESRPEHEVVTEQLD